MTELKKVTDETADSYAKFLKNSRTESKNIGTTISDLISSTADFARLGYSFNESQGLAKVANIYAVVGDEISGIDEATKSLISTMAAFKGEMTDTMSQSEFAMSIIDKFNAIGNTQPISSGGIGDALTRSASALAAANNTLDESIALITASNVVVQNPEVVGTALKTKFFKIVFVYRNMHSEHI
jgi:TP901 family phage tail tape measure protein